MQLVDLACGLQGYPAHGIFVQFLPSVSVGMDSITWPYTDRLIPEPIMRPICQTSVRVTAIIQTSVAQFECLGEPVRVYAVSKTPGPGQHWTDCHVIHVVTLEQLLCQVHHGHSNFQSWCPPRQVIASQVQHEEIGSDIVQHKWDWIANSWCTTLANQMQFKHLRRTWHLATVLRPYCVLGQRLSFAWSQYSRGLMAAPVRQ